MNKRLKRLVETQPIKGGQFLDCYNQAVSDMAGTIRTTIDHSNMFFYTEEMKDTTTHTQEPKCEVVAKLSGGKWDKSLDIMKRVYGENGLAPTQHTVGGGNMETKVQTNYRIRKLTPRECFRLMGVDEPQIDTLLSAGISNSQLYKLAGNSIVVDVLCGIFRKMFIDTANENQQMTLF